METPRRIHLRKCSVDGEILVSNDDFFKHCHSIPYDVSEDEFRQIKKDRKEKAEKLHLETYPK